MEWKVVNAISRDVERQHLNKILADIKASVGASPTQQTVTNIVNTVISQQPAPPQFPVTSVRVQLQGDVAGQGQATAGGLVVVPTSIDPALLGVPEAPNDGLPYWRVSSTWQEVPYNLQTLGAMYETGFMSMDENGNWYARNIEGVAGEIEVADGGGVGGNPLVGLADLTDSGTGAALVKITRDSKGRVEGTEDALLGDLADVDLTSVVPVAGAVLSFDGTDWVPGSSLINPMTTAGDIIVAGSGGSPQRLATGSNGDKLTIVSGVPAWQSQAYGNLVAGTNVTLTGTITNRLVGSGNVTISAGGGGGGGSIFTPPPISGWSWVNQGAASLTSTADSQTISGGASGAGLSVRGRVRGLSPASNYSVTGYFEVAMPTKSFLTAGIGWRDSTSGRLVIAVIQSNAANRFIQIYKANSPTSYNADYFVTGAVGWDRLWIRLRDDGTNRYVDVSVDGVEFVQMHSVLRTDFLTADQVGFFISTENISAPNFAPIITLKSWA